MAGPISSISVTAFQDWIEMTIEQKNQIEGLISEISEIVSSPTEIYMIGGGAMMYLGRKFFTKDMDLVVRTRREYDDVFGALVKIGFRSVRPGNGYGRMNLSSILEDDRGRRVDLFESRVCSKLRFSDNMAARSVMRFSAGNVNLNTCAPEDILIFKTITERPGDAVDCESILKGTRVHWDLVLEEIRDQIREGEEVWITWIADGMYALAERSGYDIPILDELIRMADSFLERWECELLEASGDKPI